MNFIFRKVICAAALGASVASLLVPVAPSVQAAVTSASINSVSFKAAVASTYDHTTGGGAWNDGSTTYQKGELQATDYQCGEYASFFLELTTPSNPLAGANFTTEVKLEFTRDTTGQSGVALEPETGAAHLFVQNGTNDTAPSPSTPTASIDTGTPPAVTYSGSMFTSGAKAYLTFYVKDMKPSQKVIVRSDAKINCKIGSTPTGNLQAGVTSVKVTSSSPVETISAGAQTVNFKTLGNLGYVVLEKTVTTGACPSATDTASVVVGDLVRYCYTITNYGGTKYLNVSLDDDSATPGVPGDDIVGITLTGLTNEDSDGVADDIAAAGGTPTVVTGEYELTAGYSTAGVYVNIASLKIAGVTKSTSNASVSVKGVGPSFSLTKTSSSTPSKAGDVITYTITMTNTGVGALTNASITDNKATLTSCTNSFDGTAVPQTGSASTPTTLAEEKTWTCTATYTVQAADVTAKKVDNTASAVSDEVTTQTASKTVKLTLFTITKTSTSVVSAEGDTIDYTITMTNTGDEALTGVYISDPTATFTTCTNSGGGGAVAQTGHETTITTLAPAATWICAATYTVQAADVTAKKVDNTATGNTSSATQTASKTINLALFTITKTSTSIVSKENDVITYTITMTNTGLGSLTNANITDAKATFTTCINSGGGGAVGQTGHTTTSTNLSAGASWTCTATYAVSAADVTAKKVDNTASGTTDEVGPKTANNTVNLSLFTITKTSSSAVARAGDTITYTITMTNTGLGSLTGATISDPKATLSSCTNSGGGGAVAQSGNTSSSTTLAAGNTWACTASYVLTQADVDAGKVDNVASGTTDQVGPKTAGKTVNIAQSPSFTVVKADTSKSAPTRAGDSVTFSITVTNTGTVTLKKMTVTDANATIGTCSVANGSDLAPAATMVCTASHVVTQAEVDAGKVENTAIASATGTDPVSSNKVSIPITPTPKLEVTLEQLTKKSLTAGDKVNYEVVIKNSGNVQLNSVSPVVSNFVITSCTPKVPAVLAPGEEIKCTGYHIVTEADVLLGVIKARAVASGVSALNAAQKVPAKAPDVQVPLEIPRTGSDDRQTVDLAAWMIIFGLAMMVIRRRRTA